MRKILEQALICDLTLELATYAIDNHKKILSIHAIGYHVKKAKLSAETLGDYIDTIEGLGFNAEEAYNEIAHGVVV